MSRQDLVEGIWVRAWSEYQKEGHAYNALICKFHDGAKENTNNTSLPMFLKIQFYP